METYTVQPHQYHNCLDWLGQAWDKGKRWGLDHRGIGELTYGLWTLGEYRLALGAMFHADGALRQMSR